MATTIAQLETTYGRTNDLIEDYQDRIDFFRNFHDATDFVVNESEDLTDLTACISDDIGTLKDAIKVLSVVPKLGAALKPFAKTIETLDNVTDRVQERIEEAQEKLAGFTDDALTRLDRQWMGPRTRSSWAR